MSFARFPLCSISADAAYRSSGYVHGFSRQVRPQCIDRMHAAIARLCASAFGSFVFIAAASLVLPLNAAALTIASAAPSDIDAVPPAIQEAASAGTALATSSGLSREDIETPVRIGIVSSAPHSKSTEGQTVLDPASSFLHETIERLRTGLAPRPIQVEVIAPDEISAGDPKMRESLSKSHDLLIAPSEALLQDETLGGFTRLVTKARRTGEQYADTGGTTVIVRADRQDLKTIEDLAQKSVAAPAENALSGWLSLLGELKARHYDPKKFFGDIRFTGNDAAVIRAVLAGEVDAGALPVCRLEAYARGHAFEQFPNTSLRVLSPQPTAPLACLRSTALYPETVIAATDAADEHLAKVATRMLLEMPPVNGNEWIVSRNHADVVRLAQALEIGPYENLSRSRLFVVLKEHLPVIAAIGLFMVLLLTNEWRLHALLRKRSRELEATERAKARAEKAGRDMRERLAALQTRGMVSHLSSMLAHELKQPLAAILNRCDVLKLRLNDALNDDDESAEAVLGIEGSTERIASIVERVRGYARKEEARRTRCELNAVLRATIDTYLVETPNGMPIDFSSNAAEVPVMGVEIELELLFLNLIRNAASAAAMLDTPSFVDLDLILTDPDCAVVRIANDGPVISDAAFRRISNGTPGFASATGGLGMGLSIVHLIADRHAIELRFRRRKTGGLVVEARVPVVTEAAPEATAPSLDENFNHSHQTQK